MRDFGRDIHDYYRHYVTVADAKAAGSSTVAGAALLFLASNPPDSTGMWFLFAVGIIPSTLSLILAVLTLVPRTPSGGTGVVFWSDVAKHESPDHYLSVVEGATEDELGSQLVRNNYYVATLLDTKFKTVRASMIFGIVGFVMVIVYRLLKIVVSG